MATISQQQFKKLLNQAPSGTNEEDLRKSLENKGHTIASTSVQKNVGFLERVGGAFESVGDFLRVEKFGRGIGRTAFNIGGELGVVPEEEGLEETRRGLMQQQEELRQSGRTDLAQRAGENLQDFSEREEQVRTGGLSSREVVGSAALTGLNILTPGISKAGAVRAGTMGSRVARVGTVAGTEGALGATFGALGGVEQGGDLQDVKNMAIAGGAIGSLLPIGAKGLTGTAKFTSKKLTNFTKRITSALTGKPEDVLETAFARPRAAKEGFRKGSQVLNEVADEAVSKIRNFLKELNKNYQQVTDDIFSKVTRSLDDIKQTILSNTDDILNSFGVKSSKEGLDFSGSAIVDPGEVKRVERAFDLVRTWDDYSAKGVNLLRQRLGEIRRFDTNNGTRSSALVGKIYNEVNQQLRKQVPELAELNTQYGTKRDFLEALELIFKDARGGTKENIQITRKLATLFNANKETTRQLVEQLEAETGIDILGRVAGRDLSRDAGRFQLGAGNIVNQVLQIFGVPKFFSKRAINAGQVNQWFTEVVQKLSVGFPAFQALEETVKVNIIRQIVEDIYLIDDQDDEKD